MDNQDIFFNQFKELNKDKYKTYSQKINAVYEIFQNFYGEENVDLQGLVSEDVYLNKLWNISKENNDNIDDIDFSKSIFTDNSNAYIYVHWSKITIQNEYGNSHLIKDLFARIPVSEEGTGGMFRLNRSTYTDTEISSDYMHSHVCGIPSNVSCFLDCCLGSGPIKDTIYSLRDNYNEDLWKLFCLELNLYVQTESETGIPYRHIKDIGTMSMGPNTCIRFNTFCNEYLNVTVNPHDPLEFKQLNLITKFIKHLAQTQPKYIAPAFLSTVNGIDLNFKPRYDIINISNDFIKFVNTLRPVDIALSKLIMEEVFIDQRGVGFMYDYNNDNICNQENGLVLFFKSQPVHLKIEKTRKKKPYNILKPHFIKYVLYFFKYAYNCPINFNSYGREENNIIDKKCTII